MIRRLICRTAVGVLAVVFLSPIPASATVNCKFVLKNLSLPGRTVESVAETMSISEDEIRKCQEEAEKKAADAAATATQGAAEAGETAK